jgi:hypothetical protein
LVVTTSRSKRQDSRNHEVAALELRVEPDANLGGDERRTRSQSGRCRQLARVVGNQGACVAQRDVRRVRIGAVRHDLHSRRRTRANSPAVLDGDRQRHPRASGIEVRIDLADRRQSVDDHEALRRLESAHQVAALAGAILIDDHERYVADVRRCRIPEHRQLDDGRHDDDAEQARILTELEELLADDVQSVGSCPLASQPERRKAENDRREDGERDEVDQNTSGPTPFNTMPRSATRKYAAGTMRVTSCRNSGMLEIGKMNRRA